MTTYNIVRFYQDDRPNEVTQTGLTLQQAKKHCNDPATQGIGQGWFDGYEEAAANTDADYAPSTPTKDPRFPDRPDHPDFWKMSEIVNQLDDLAQDKGWLEAMDTVPCDVRSMLYMAGQRAAMSQKLLADQPESQRLSIQWTDAFAVGVRYGMSLVTSIEQVLDESVDGNRRQGN